MLSIQHWNIYMFGQEMFGSDDINVETLGGKRRQNWRHDVKNTSWRHERDVLVPLV